MDVEVIFNQTSMTKKKSYGWKLWPDKIKRKHDIYSEQQGQVIACHGLTQDGN